MNWSKLGSKARSNSRIQFASNGSKLVDVNVDPAPSSKVCLCHWLSIKLFHDETLPNLGCSDYNTLCVNCNHSSLMERDS
jgi:hypothetical protein